MAVLPAPPLQNACKKAKNGSFARTEASKCVQEGQKQRFCPHIRPKMRAERQKMAVLPALPPKNACKKAKNGSSARTATAHLQKALLFKKTFDSCKNLC